MIIGFVGTPGSGKSYEAVCKILDNIKLGRKIYTNIRGLDDPKCKEYIKRYCNITDFQLETCLNFLTDEQATFPDLHCERGSLVLIDEVHKLFSNRDWQTDKNKNFAEWASTHRHDGYDLVLITQDIEKIDKHARTLIEWTYLFRKVNFFGGAVQQKYLCYSYAGDDHNGQPLKKNVKNYNPEVFKCYKSYSDEEVKEIGFMKNANILKHPIFYSIPVVLALTLYFFSKSSLMTGDLFSTSAVVAQTESKSNHEIPKSVDNEPRVQSTPVRQDDHVLRADVEEIDQTAIINKYRLLDGRIIYTNNGYTPSGSIYISTL